MLRFLCGIGVACVLALGCGDDASSGDTPDASMRDGQVGDDGGSSDARVDDGRVVLPDADIPETRTSSELLALLPELQCTYFRECFGEQNCLSIEDLATHVRSGEAAVLAGDASVERDNLVRCVRTLESGVCATSHNTLSVTNSNSACEGIFVGTSTLGDACTSDIACPEGSTCVGARAGCTGTCRAKQKAGQACGYGVASCEGACMFDGDRMGTFCVEPRVERQVCTEDSDCAPGLDCTPGGNENYCTRRGRHGSKCRGDSDCPGGVCALVTDGLDRNYLQCLVPDQVAEPGERCGPYPSGGERTCVTGYFCGRNESDSAQDWARSCTPVVSLGQTCRQGVDFPSEDCEKNAWCSEEKTCVADLPAGSACSRSSQCAGETLCHPFDLKCTPSPAPVGAGQACDFWQACQDGLVCANNTCKAPATTGQACDRLVGCAADDEYCSNETNTCVKSPALGDACDPFGPRCFGEGVFCGDTMQCVGPPTKLGDECILSSQCPAWLVCHNSMCVERLPLGADCVSDEQCATDLACAFSERKCAPRLAEGASCELTDWCTGVCDFNANKCTCDF